MANSNPYTINVSVETETTNDDDVCSGCEMCNCDIDEDDPIVQEHMKAWEEFQKTYPLGHQLPDTSNEIPPPEAGIWDTGSYPPGFEWSN